MKSLYSILIFFVFTINLSIAQSFIPIGFDFNSPLGVETDSYNNPWVVTGGSGNNDGSVIRYSANQPEVIVNNLPSFFNVAAGELQGPLNVFFLDDDSFYVIIGGGPGPAFGSLALFNMTDYADKGDPLTLDDAREIIEISSWVLEQGYAESNPYAIAHADNGDIIISDAAANAVFRYNGDTGLSVLADLPSSPNPLPFGPPFIEPVPTQILSYPDGGFLVGTLTGFPFITGAARVFHISDAGEVSDYLTGLTLITDMAYDYDGDLLVQQFASFGPMGFGFGSAQLIKVSEDGDRQIIASGYGPSAGLGVAENGNIYTSHLFLGQLLELERCIAESGVLSIPSARESTSVCVGNGRADKVSFRVKDDIGHSQLVITDPDGLILAITDQSTIDFDNTGSGVCTAYNVSSGSSVSGLEEGKYIEEISGCYSISNGITIDRKDCQGCHAPLNMRYHQSHYGSYTVQWDQVNAADWYQIAIGYDDDPENSYSTLLKGNKIRITDSANRKLIIQVRALCGSEYGAISYVTIDPENDKSLTIEGTKTKSDQYDDIETISLSVLSNSEITIYPNPAVNYLHVSLDNPIKTGIIQMIDMQGRTLKSYSIIANSKIQKVDISDMSAGFYFVKVSSHGQDIINEKIIVID